MPAVASEPVAKTPRANSAVQGDCIELMQTLPDSTVDLVFADPPFNIGYEYDVYNDRIGREEYLKWSEEWMSEVVRLLRPTGAFWLAIGDEYAAELKVLATRELGLICRNWVIWYYTFGVHCHGKFTRSHAHLFYFVTDPQRAKFNDNAIRVPSARQLVYNDKRADPRGRVPDDTWVIRPTPDESWILRPQDLPDGFSAEEDTWFIPRVCGTFKERQGFHGCQMPEQLLGRIIRTCTTDHDLVLDPFAGSGTSAAVAKKLGRKYLTFELSDDYVKETRRRLVEIRTGDRLLGSDNPTSSAPKTLNGKVKTRRISRNGYAKQSSRAQRKSDPGQSIIQAFTSISRGYSSDRVIADPRLNKAYGDACQRLGLPGGREDWNRRLLGLRKANQLRLLQSTTTTRLDATLLSELEFASEIALGLLRSRVDAALDTILCNPKLAREFDALAEQIWPIDQDNAGLYYRWAALGLRKRAKNSRTAARAVAAGFSSNRFHRTHSIRDLRENHVPAKSAAYLIRQANRLYVGTTPDLREWYARCRETGTFAAISRVSRRRGLELAYRVVPATTLSERRGIQSYFVGKKPPEWNYPDLASDPSMAA